MITEIEVKNFKTLRDVKIPLAPGITVMVGANNSGKSNALAVLKLLAQGERQKDFRAAIEALGGMQSLRAREAVHGVEISLHVKTQYIGRYSREKLDYRCEYEWRLDGTLSRRLRYEDRNYDSPREIDYQDPREIWSEPHQESVKQLSEFLGESAIHDLSIAALRAPAVVRQDVQLGPDGRDAAAVLDALAGESPSLRDAIDETVRRTAHEVKRVVTRPGPTPGTKVLGIEEKDGRVYGAEDTSDGLLLFIGLAIAAQRKVQTPRILAIEEPERGIHPRRLRDLVDHLLSLTKSGVQIVLTTHSPTLLDEFRDSPESVLIFDRDEKGTHITRLSDRPDWAKDLKGAPLGELWYSGVLGGVPGR